jgi:AraC family transcriptional regulator
MTPVTKALWYIESHFVEVISLDDIALVTGYSRFYMSRAFALTVGCSIPAYVRGRRLTEAARKLAAGATDILAVALEVGYSSHEAFTRAFRDQFGTTPEVLRAEGTLNNITLVEPKQMTKSSAVKIESPRFVDGQALLIAGLGMRHSSNAGMPAQWQRFVPYIGTIAGQVGRCTYGVLHNGDDAGQVDYLTGVEVKDFSEVPKELSTVCIPVQHYAVFTHRDHVSSINKTWTAVFNEWIPASSHELADGPQFERFGEDFDGAKGTGSMEIWVPVIR